MGQHLQALPEVAAHPLIATTQDLVGRLRASPPFVGFGGARQVAQERGKDLGLLLRGPPGAYSVAACP